MINPIKLLPGRVAGRSALAAGLVVVALSTSVVGAKASTYPVVSFDIKYGQTFTEGTITFYNRSVIIDVTVRAVGDECRWTNFYVYDVNGHLQAQQTNSDDYVCSPPGGGAVDQHYVIDMGSDVPGGAGKVVVGFYGTAYTYDEPEQLGLTTTINRP